jgi:transglutaminase-like putative cysteine protease
MQMSIRHRLSLGLGAGLSRSVQHLLLTPQSGNTQTVREWHIDMPGIDEAPGFFDAFGNRAHLASQTKPEAELIIAVSGVVETHDTNGVIGRLEREPVPALFRRVTPLTKADEAMVAPIRRLQAAGKGRIALLHALMEQVGEAIGAPRQMQSQGVDGQQQSQSGDTTPVAADYSHAFIGVARALGIPARYVTGYWSGEDDAPPAFHAWAEAFDDSLGWICFDALLGVCPTDRHVRVACGLDALSTAPVRSVPATGAPQHLTMDVEAVAQ